VNLFFSEFKIGLRRIRQRVAEAFADGRNVHASFQQQGRVAVAHGVERCSLGKLERPAKTGHTESGFSGVPSKVWFFRLRRSALRCS
jgi:hypothetical protein